MGKTNRSYNIITENCREPNLPSSGSAVASTRIPKASIRLYPPLLTMSRPATRVNAGSSAIFFGAVYGEEKLNRIANMDVFLHPSRNEGLPTAVLEASGLGVPCIVSEETNVGSVVRRFNAGIVLEKNNVQSLKESLVRFRYESNRFSLSPLKENAKRMVEEEFDWRIIAHRLQALYLS